MGAHLPAVVHFEHLGNCYYSIMGTRPPKRGEYYLSGAIMEAYRAPADFNTPYIVVRPTFHATRASVWVMGAPIGPEET